MLLNYVIQHVTGKVGQVATENDFFFLAGFFLSCYQFKRISCSIRLVLKIKSFSFLSGQVITLFLLVDNHPAQNLRAFVLH